MPARCATSARFGSGVFKNGFDPYRMYQTLTRGFGQMAACRLDRPPVQKYDRDPLYLREEYLQACQPDAVLPDSTVTTWPNCPRERHGDQRLRRSSHGLRWITARA